MTDFDFRAKKAKWLKVLLSEELPTRKIFLYGSVSKPGWLDQDYTPSFDENSDYDFAIEYSPVSVRHLDNPENGWCKKEKLDYQDRLTSSVYERQVAGFKVQVSLRYDLDAFIRAWNSIPSSFYWKYLNKRSPTAFPREDVREYLDQLFDIARTIKAEEQTSLEDSIYRRMYNNSNQMNGLYAQGAGRYIGANQILWAYGGPALDGVRHAG